MGARLISPVDPLVLNQRTSTLEFRAGMATAFPSSVGDRLLVEGGVLPSADDAMFATTSSGTTSSPSVTVGSGQAVIPVTGNYGYECTWPAGQGAIALTAPPATNPRKDLLVARVYNAAESGDAFTGFYLETIDGTPASNPVPPTVPPGSIPLKDVQVSTGGVLTITDRIYYTRAAGGVRRTENDGSRAGSHPRDLRINTLGTLDVWQGGAWQTLATPAIWSQFTPTLYYSGAASGGTGAGGTMSLGTGGSAIGRYIIVGKTCTLRYAFRGGSGGFGGSGSVYTTLPPGLTSAPIEETQILAKLNVLDYPAEVYLGPCFIPSNNNLMYPFFARGIADCRLAPYTIATSNGAAGTGIPYIGGSYPSLGILIIQGQIEVA